MTCQGDQTSNQSSKRVGGVRGLTAALLLAEFLLANQTPVLAADWPTRAIHAIVPVAAGSATDSISRLIFDKLAPRLGQAIVVENRPGASGSIGATLAAKADPDGYTWLVINNVHTMSRAISPNVSYDLNKDFTGVTLLGTSPVVLVVPPMLHVDTIQDLVKLAKSKPGSLTYAVSGLGTPAHIAGALFRLSADIDTRMVPFKSPPEATTETMAGRIDYFFATIPVSQGLIKDGRLIPLAVYGSIRASALPNVPTTIEAGYAKTDNNFWFGLVVPATTPSDIISRINAEITTTLADPELQSKLREVGLEPRTMPVDEFNSYLRREVQEAPAIVKAAGLSDSQ